MDIVGPGEAHDYRKLSAAYNSSKNNNNNNNNNNNDKQTGSICIG